MIYLWGALIFLLSPAIVAGSALFPFYWIGQYRILRRSGSWSEVRDFGHPWRSRFLRAIAAGYVLVLGALFFPGTFPRLLSALEKGHVLWVLVPAALDALVFIRFLPDRAMEKWRRESRRPAQ